jgi:hypothetical protein
MKPTHFNARADDDLSLESSRNLRRVLQMRALLGHIPLYEAQANGCLRTGGRSAESRYWLDLFNELQDLRLRIDTRTHSEP